MQMKLSSSDDLILVRLIAESGTLAGAARALGVNHATVFRRLNAIEARLGARLFERGRSQYVVTAAGEAALEHGRRIEDELLAFERAITGVDLVPAGTVRLATTDTLLAGPLGSILAEFRHVQPAIEIEVATSNIVADLTRREADLALRPSLDPPETLIGRRVGRIEMAVYAGRFNTRNADDRAAWIGPDDSFGDTRLTTYFTKNALVPRIRTNTFTGMLALAEAGHGRAVLPCYLADKARDLVRTSPPVAELATDLWLLRHPALRNTARIKALSDFLAEALARHGLV